MVSNLQLQRVKEIFTRVVEEPRERRTALLDSACGDEPRLRRKIERMLEAHDSAAEWMESPTRVLDGDAFLDASDTAASDTAASIPERIGGYRIKRRIASGGMGTVYEAVQESPRRTVAVKVMRRGLTHRSAALRNVGRSHKLAFRK